MNTSITFENGTTLELEDLLRVDVLFNKKAYSFYTDHEGSYLLVDGVNMSIVGKEGGYNKLSKLKAGVRRYLLHDCPDTTNMDRIHPEFKYHLISLGFK